MQKALAQFRADLALVRRSAEWIANTLPSDAISLSIGSATYSGFTILLCGYFESFVKATMKAFVGKVNTSNKRFIELPKSLRLQHFRGGSKRVQDGVGRARESNDLTVLHDLARRLASVAGQPFEVVWEAFTETHANPNSERIKELASKVGIEDLWAKLRPMAAGYGDLRLFLDAFIEVRNECAHSGTPSAPPVYSDVIGYIDNLQVLATAFVAVHEAHLATALA
jgi:hypothetical protein